MLRRPVAADAFRVTLTFSVSRGLSMRQRLAICAAVLVPCIVLLVGCGGPKGPKTVGVSGTVYIDNKPAPNIAVFFQTDKHTGVGRTNAEGKYTLAQGAEPGTNRISFNVAQEESKQAVEEGMDAGQMEAAGMAGGAVAKKPAAGPALPERYKDPANSGITFDVPAAGTDSADFRLDSK